MTTTSLDQLLAAVTEYAPDADNDVVVQAYLFAARAHNKQTRKSGEPYFIHPLAVAGILAGRCQRLLRRFLVRFLPAHGAGGREE